MKTKLADKSLTSNLTRIVRVKSALRSPKNGQRTTTGANETAPHTSKEDKRHKSTDGIQSEQTSTELLEDISVISAPPIFPKQRSILHVESAGAGHLEPWVNNEIDSMISGMTPALLLGQCFSLMGISNVACQHAQEPHFRWLSLRMLFSIIMLSLITGTFILSVSYYGPREPMRVVAYQASAFYLNCILASCLFIRLSRRWASLCIAFQNLEKQLSYYGTSSGLKRRMRIITAAVLSVALVEHCTAQTNTVLVLRQDTFNQSQREWLQRYYETQFQHVCFYFPYSPFAVFVTFIVNVTTTFIWNYNDLFIMLISVAISSKFQHLYDALVARAHEDKDVKSWRRSRETFNAISSLTQMVECNLSLHVLLSFVNNLLFICIQLLHTVRYETKTLFASFYSAVSFGSLVLRAVSVSLFAASIPEKSRAIKRVLFSVPSENYSVEVERFIHQVSFDDIAFTGCNFFSITRPFLLTVFGTVATYELVLVQFNNLNSS